MPKAKQQTAVVVFPESHQDLLKTDIAILSTVSRSGHPQVTAVWFLWDDDGYLKLSLNTTRQKVKNLRERSECTLFILDRANLGRTLEVRANAQIVPDTDYAFAAKLGKKYGADIRTMDQAGDGRVMVVLRPVKVNTNG